MIVVFNANNINDWNIISKILLKDNIQIIKLESFAKIIYDFLIMWFYGHNIINSYL